MDAANPSALPTAANRTPLRVGRLSLLARDAPALAAYYRRLLGLSEIGAETGTITLGTAGGLPLLEIVHRPDSLPDDPREAGLYHTAFLMPTRADHARWVQHLGALRTPITGASDHGVSEAFYLDDPEGNGIEIYNDRPAAQWRREGDRIVMPTTQLDIKALLSLAGPSPATYDAAPDGLRIGHVHLRVGDIAQAEAFYRDVVGLDVTRTRGGATFLSSGGYHHHIGANVWHSAGAGRRNPERAGLATVTLEVERATLDGLRERATAAGVTIHDTDNGFALDDPWGTRLIVVAA